MSAKLRTALSEVGVSIGVRVESGVRDTYRRLRGLIVWRWGVQKC